MPVKSGTMQVRYRSPGPIAKQFLFSDAFVKGIRGPIGSGKSTACIMCLVRGFQKQKPGPDNIIRRRSAVIRNTYPELKTTTIPSWHQWIPQNQGKWIDQGPPRQHIVTAPQGDVPGSDWEIWFLALDRPEDVRKLLSMELSDAWINEAREVPKAILDGLTGRVSRYPAIRDGGCTDPQIVLDTNPPDSDHWWGKLSDFKDGDFEANTLKLETQLREIGSLRAEQPLYAFYSQPGGLSAGAENTKNLEKGYYLRASAGKSEDWIKIYVDGEYGFVVDGKPVYPEYKDSVHCQAFEINKSLPIYVGIDFGLTPAATFGQRTVTGAWRWFDELVSEDMGAKRFGEILAARMREKYGTFQFAGITGDPSGDTRAQSDETTAFQILRSCGVMAVPASTNDPVKRREAVALYLNKMVDGQPGLLVHPDCKQLRKAMAGGYHRRRVQVTGEERYADEAVKDMYSHVAEAAQYMMIGAGEARTVIQRDDRTRPPRRPFAIMDYRILE